MVERADERLAPDKPLWTIDPCETENVQRGLNKNIGSRKEYVWKRKEGDREKGKPAKTEGESLFHLFRFPQPGIMSFPGYRLFLTFFLISLSTEAVANLGGAWRAGGWTDGTERTN